jgi:predicted O-methyltransferase YrrM
MNLNDYLYLNYIFEMEGFSQQLSGQVDDLKKLVSDPLIKKVLEIGFNAGHSAEIFLKTNPNIQLTSFDLNCQACVTFGKQFIDMTYPGRHTLISGDSTFKIPEFVRSHPNEKFDLIFIDGGYDYETAALDLYNCKKIANKSTIVAMDGVSYNLNSSTIWAINPTAVWEDAKKNKVVYEIQHSEYGNPGRGMSWGNYIF